MVGINKAQVKIQHAQSSSMKGSSAQGGDEAQASIHGTDPLSHHLTFSKL